MKLRKITAYTVYVFVGKTLEFGRSSNGIAVWLRP